MSSSPSPQGPPSAPIFEPENILARSAAALVIGNELLTAKIQDENLHQLASTLRRLGVPLRRALVIPDDREIIRADVRALSDSHDIVFTSGGIGPTHDDLTIESVAEAFGVDVVSHPVMAARIREAYGGRVTPGHLRMARVPEGARLLASPDVPYPTVVVGNVWILPGVPELFRMKLATVRHHVRGTSQFFSHAVYVQLDEVALKPLLDQVVEHHGHVEVGSYPKWFDETYRTKVTFDARDASSAREALDEFLSLLPEGEPQRVAD